jgi:hypothetical protein
MSKRLCSLFHVILQCAPRRVQNPALDRDGKPLKGLVFSPFRDLQAFGSLRF